MKIRYIISALALAMVTVSCYEDKGNYDYLTLNNATVSFEIEDTTIPVGTELDIEPKLTFSMGSEPQNLSYEWKFMGRVVSTDRHLKWNIAPVGNGALMLYVTDNTTGIQYIGSQFVTVTTKYGKRGWMVLSEKDGKAMLSYITESRSIKEDETGKRYITCTADVDAYRKNNGVELGGTPVKIYEHFRNYQWVDANMGNFWVLQKGGQGVIDIDGSSLVNDVTLENMFVGGLPADFVPYDIVDMTYITLVVSENGKVYSRKKEDIELYNSGLFTNRPLTDSKNVEIDGRHFVRAPYAESGMAMFYNEPTNNYQIVSTRSSIYAGMVLPVKASETDYEANPNFSRLEDLGDNKPVFIGAYKDPDGFGRGCFVSLLKSQTSGKFYIQDFRLSSVAWSNATTPELIDQKEVNLSGIIDGVSKNVFHQALFNTNSSCPCLFVSKNNELWFVYLGDGRYTTKKLYTFNGNITSMNADIYNSVQLAVGLDNGEFHILDTSWKSITGEYGDNINLYTETGFGDVKQVVYKFVDDTMWIPQM